MNPESLNTFDRRGRELRARSSPPARFSSLPGLQKSQQQKTKTKTKNHLHKFLYKTRGPSITLRNPAAGRKYSSLQSPHSPAFHAPESSLSTINHQPSTPPLNPQPSTPSPKEHCLACHSLLRPPHPDGQRPSPSCPNCGTRLPLPGTSIIPALEYCPACDAALPRLLPNGQRPHSDCLRCSEPLPPPGAAIPIPAEHCLECGACLPSPLPPSLWLSEYCRLCGIHLPQPFLSRHRPDNSCPTCHSPLPPLPSTP